MKTFSPAIDWHRAADAVKRAMTMRELLQHLGAKPRGRNRFDCPFCDGGQRGTMSMIRGAGSKCHRCGVKGDVISIARLARNCGFVTAVKWLAALGHVSLPEKMTREECARFREQEALYRRVANGAARLDRLERDLRLAYRDFIHSTERKRDEVIARLAQLRDGSSERHRGEHEGCWGWLAALEPLLREALIAYSILAFGSALDRAVFTLEPDVRQQMIVRVRFAGGLKDDDDRFVEVLA